MYHLYSCAAQPNWVYDTVELQSLTSMPSQIHRTLIWTLILSEIKKWKHWYGLVCHSAFIKKNANVGNDDSVHFSSLFFSNLMFTRHILYSIGKNNVFVFLWLFCVTPNLLSMDSFVLLLDWITFPSKPSLWCDS